MLANGGARYHQHIYLPLVGHNLIKSVLTPNFHNVVNFLLSNHGRKSEGGFRVYTIHSQINNNYGASPGPPIIEMNFDRRAHGLFCKGGFWI